LGSWEVGKLGSWEDRLPRRGILIGGQHGGFGFSSTMQIDQEATHQPIILFLPIHYILLAESIFLTWNDYWTASRYCSPAYVIAAGGGSLPTLEWRWYSRRKTGRLGRKERRQVERQPDSACGAHRCLSGCLEDQAV
jgi:hypothetical protein